MLCISLKLPPFASVPKKLKLVALGNLLKAIDPTPMYAETSFIVVTSELFPKHTIELLDVIVYSFLSLSK